METQAKRDYLVFGDQAGNYFAIPANELEKYAVGPEHKAEIEAALDEEVSGYSYMLNEMVVGGIQADRRVAGAQERLARKARKENAETEATTMASERSESPLANALFLGKFLALSILRR